MKASLVVGIACIWLICSHAIAGNYILTVEGKKHEVDVGKPTIIELRDGKSIVVTLEKKAVVSFTSENFSFDHPSGVTPSRSDLGDGIHQTMMSTPLGTAVIIQEYANMDPSGLVDMMVNELTKEEKRYGYKISMSPAEMKLANGIVVKGKKVDAEYRGEQSTRHVLCHSIRDAGILVITVVDKEAPPEDQIMIETFWKTFIPSLK